MIYRNEFIHTLSKTLKLQAQVTESKILLIIASTPWQGALVVHTVARWESKMPLLFIKMSIKCSDIYFWRIQLGTCIFFIYLK